MPEVLVTGGCGFIGSHLVDALLSQGFKVRVMDNLSNGSLENLKCGQRDKLEIINGNLTDKFLLDSAVKGCETVFHLAAHANVQNSAKDTGIDLENNTLATHNLLEAMRRNQVDRLVFASSAAVYGESGLTVLDEDYGPLLPISLYGASKLAGEGLISAYSHLYGLKATMFRFANIVGSRRHSGVIYDFVSRLRQNPSSLLVLGDGSQSKPYLHVSDCVAGMLLGFENQPKIWVYIIWARLIRWQSGILPVWLPRKWGLRMFATAIAAGNAAGRGMPLRYALISAVSALWALNLSLLHFKPSNWQSKKL